MHFCEINTNIPDIESVTFELNRYKIFRAPQAPFYAIILSCCQKNTIGKGNCLVTLGAMLTDKQVTLQSSLVLLMMK